MKKILPLIFFLILIFNACEALAQNKTLSLPRKSKNKIDMSSRIELGMYYNYMIPSIEGKRFHDTAIEVRGWNRIDFLDIYWSWNFSNFMRTSVLSNMDKSAKNYQYGILAPRLSIDKMARSNFSFLIFKEWFLSYRFEFDSPDAKGSNLLKHNIGIGVDLAIPLFDRFKTNIYARYTEKNYGRGNYSWNGYLFSVDYMITIYRFQSGIEFLYEGWLDVVFGAKANDNADPQWAKESVMWKNTFKIGYKGLAIGYTYQFNKNLNGIKYKSSDISQQSVGLSYTIVF